MSGCVRCGLPENYAGIKLDEHGVCNYCHFYDEHRSELTDYEALEKKFAAEIEKAKEKAKENGAKYDCIVGVSGGKDGAYITYQLKHKYGMRVLTYTLDNGFSTDFGKNNIANLLDKLDVDHIRITVNESKLRGYYSACMKLMHNFCSVCFHLCHYYSHLLASQYKIPLIVNGRTHMQVLQAADCTKGIEPFEISRNLADFEYQMFGRLVEKMAKTKRLDYLPEAEVTSLSYFMYHDVTDEEKMAFLQEKIGWNRPKSTVPHPDCWAHHIAEKCSIEKLGYPVRTGELAVSAREGSMPVEESIAEREKDAEYFSTVDPELEARFYERIKKR